MSTYFDTLARNYTQVPITADGIDTATFLEATEGLIKLFDLLESSAFTPVQSDMRGNVKKIREKYETDPSKYTTLQKIVLGDNDKNKTATVGLLWLKRGLEFTALALRRSVDNPAEELTVSFTKAYEGTLKQYHNFMVKGVFTVSSCF
ncbi:glycolipid transfer protein domain-containing protein [Paraphysoderma sedebokerense]|nr:glycolipid transfer protein domain-containing protein [Paraphysoderma sedebokerense]